MNLFVPFDVDKWHDVSNLPLYLFLSSYGLIGMAVLTLSQFVLRKLMGFELLTNGKFIVWFILELLVLSFAMFLFFGTNDMSQQSIIQELRLSLWYTGLVLILPYSMVLLYLSNQIKNKKFETLKFQAIPDNNSTVTIKEENDKVVLAIKMNSYLYLKSEGNYVTVYYLANEEVKKKLVRTSLKKLEAEVPESHFIRIHRSYMINLENMEVAGKTSKGYEVILKGLPDKFFPVSAGYKKTFEERVGLER